MRPMPTRKLLDVASDFHGHEHSKSCLALLCAHLRDRTPDVFVLNGDIVDFEVVSKYGPMGRMGVNTVLKEANETLTDIIFPIMEALGFEIRWTFVLVDPENPALKDVVRVKVLKCINHKNVKIWWIEGNHEMRLKRHMWALAQALDGLVTFDRIFSLKELGIEYVHSTGSLGNGILHLNPHLMVMHGERYGINQAKQQIDDVMGSVIMGHGHKQGMFRKSSNITGKDYVGYACGTMSKNPTYRSTPNFNRGHVSGWFDAAPPYRFNLHHTNIISATPHLPEDPKAYPRRVTEPEHSILLTPWGEYQAMEDAYGGWGVTCTWREGLQASDGGRKVRAKARKG